MDLPSPPKSLWRETAPAMEDSPAPQGDISCDVAIVGGGFTGLHAAHAFADAGLSVAVFEAGPVGLGGSGRNGGVVSAKFRRAFTDLAKCHGLDTARRMHGIANASVDHLIATIERFDLKEAGFQRVGALKCAHTKAAFDHAREEADWLGQTLGETGLHVLDREAVTEETGCDGFVGGVLQDRAGALQPLAYLQGLWAAARARGIAVYANAPVTDISESGTDARLRIPGGEISAKQAFIATNAYSSLTNATRRLARSLVPFRSSIVATEKLPADLDARLLKRARSYTETRRMMRWFRKVDGRIVFGGRGALGHVDSPAASRRLEQAMRTIFPMLGDVGVDYRWSGYVALSMDGLPMAGMLSDRIGYAAGFNGSGVAMSGYVGNQVAQLMTGRPHELALIERASVPAVPFYAFRSIGVRAVTFSYELMDAAGL
ncbi:NAD(P)/FAD-dependent oxidoreductase [Rhodobium gokarnense]|uniref:Glycine/D-amino acid oxidase-like deaminating enzyme n=1 Tax=Rhodobium gokarnense TaxID=364296 RepID=A0ABT3H8F4_9HYPH|nr:FAD-binding oxidoreductase [Rhodobium gokarnense]MCW2306666.1 glycine/D-amino acid oxidase-like deaminating enzyme [Rhodobium gokarnense]